MYALLLGALAVLILLSGLDDLVPALVCWWHSFRAEEQPDATSEYPPERRIAIFVPCWNESAVIADMVRHNVAAIRYQNYDFFLGVYPNDGPTVEVTQGLAAKLKNVHVAECGHPGPTSKADCLNWIYRRMREHEEATDTYFDTVVIHDAEDLIHPEALALINLERQRYDMVQVPVLPLPTPALELTHGIYCDDFAEYQWIDMRARQITGSFIPSNGVGTGYSRKILDRIARTRRNVVFDPESLTEDYDSGIRIHALGFSQTFCPLRHSGASYLATREYFPRRFGAAVRQRTRWVMGNALQSWEKNGWRGSLATKYWLWRDRKGLLTNPIGLLTSLAFLAGVFTWIISRLEGQEWPMRLSDGWVSRLCVATLALQCLRLAIRMEYVRRIFGVQFAFFAPLRSFHSNLINALATVSAIVRYANAKLHGRALTWLKTDHTYPDRGTLASAYRNLEDVLVASGLLEESALQSARRRLPDDAELDDYLVHKSLLSEEDLGEILSIKEGVPAVLLDPDELDRRVARVLPVQAEPGLYLIPFRVERGRLLVAGPVPPKPDFREVLRRFTKLEVEFHLVTWRNFEELRSLLV